MTNSSSRSRNNILLGILIITFILFIFNLPLIFEEAFLQIRIIIERSASDVLDKNVSIEKIGFLPYGELILHNVNIYDKENDISYGSVKRCHVRFKLLPLLLNKIVLITKVSFKEPVLFPHSKYLKISLEQNRGLDEYKLELDEYILIKVSTGRLIFIERGPVSDEIDFNFWARLHEEGKGFYSEGWIDLRKYSLKEYILNNLFFFEFIDKIGYRLKTSLTENEIFVDELELDFGQFKIGATGVIENYKEDPILDLKVGLIDLGLPEDIYLKSKLLATTIRNLIVQIKGAFRDPHWFVSLDALRSRFTYLPVVLKIDNFYCNLRLSRQRLLIEECSCFLNNFPIGLTCELTDFKSPSIKLNAISHPGQLVPMRRFNPLNFEFSFSGYKDGSSLRAKVLLQVERLFSSQPRMTHNVKFTIDDLLCRFSNETVYSSEDKNVAPLLMKARDIVYERDFPAPGIRVDVSEFNSSLYPHGTKIYFSDSNLLGYGGSLKGDGFVALEGLSPELFFDFEFSEFNMSELAGVLNLDYDLAGDLSGKAVLDTNAFSCLAGESRISNGYIKNVKLLGLIADFLTVSSLKDVYFDDFSSNFLFSVAGEQIMLNDIKIRSSDIYLDANLTLKNRHKLNGDILVRLSTGLLKESFKLRLLFMLMGKMSPYVDFEFKIGGFLESPHIKWLDTRFRKSVVRYLSEGGQKAIEKRIEKAINPLLENK